MQPCSNSLKSKPSPSPKFTNFDVSVPNIKHSRSLSSIPHEDEFKDSAIYINSMQIMQWKFPANNEFSHRLFDIIKQENIELKQENMKLKRENNELKADNKRFYERIINLKDQIKDWMKKCNILQHKDEENGKLQQEIQSYIYKLQKQLDAKNEEIQQMNNKMNNSSNKRKKSRHRRAETHSLNIKARDVKNKTKRRNFIEKKPRKDSIGSIESMESSSSYQTNQSVGSEYSPTVSALSMMGYHGLKQPSIAFDLKRPNATLTEINLAQLSDSMGIYDFGPTDSGSEAESISSDQMKTWHADSKKKKKYKGGKTHRTDYGMNRDKNVEQMMKNVRQQQCMDDAKYLNKCHSENMKGKKKLFTQNKTINLKPSNIKKMRRRSFVKQKNGALHTDYSQSGYD